MNKVRAMLIFYSIVLILGLVGSIWLHNFSLAVESGIFWAVLGTWSMSYIGTAKVRKASNIPIQLCLCRKGFFPDLEFSPWYRCSECNTRLKTRDMIPLISYLWYRGRCRYCGRKYESSTFKRELLGLILGPIALLRLYHLVEETFIGEIKGEIA